MGRSCLVAACYLLHCGQQDSAAKALEMVAQQRYPITIPSQIRYVYYYEKLLRSDRVLLSTFRLLSIRCQTVPETSGSLVLSGCTPYLEIYTYVKQPGGWAIRQVFSGKHLSKRYLASKHREMVFDL
eukprot:gene330-414_t